MTRFSKILDSFKVSAAMVTFSAGLAVPGQYLVQVKPEFSKLSRNQLERSLHISVIEKIRPDVLLVSSSLDRPQSRVVRHLSHHPFVQFAEPNLRMYAFQTPDDPEFVNQWGLRNTGALDKEGLRGLTGVDMQAEKAWDVAFNLSPVTVAVIDTGVDFAHPDMKESAWTNEVEARGVAGVDDDQNGYVDDIHGFNFVNNSGDIVDDNGHGTHCAGSIAASKNNQVGIAGLAPNAKIMAVKFLDQNGGGNLANAIKAIDYARKMKAQILSNSWGGPGNSPLLRKAVEETRDAQQIFVAAAGNSAVDNDKSPPQPAGFTTENIIAVAAVDNRGSLSDFSNFGAKSVHVAAPGTNILSTIPGGYETYSGTSMAAPNVAAISALILGKNPTLNYAEVKERVVKTSRKLAGLNGKMVGGLVDASRALDDERSPLPDPNDPSLWLNKAPQQVSTPHPYTNGYKQKSTIRIMGAKKLAVHFSQFKTEAAYDRVEFSNAKGELLGTWSGNHTGEYSPIAEGDTLILTFASDVSNTDWGYDVDFAVTSP